VHYHGQPVALVVAETIEVARQALALIDVGYEPLPAVLTIPEAREAESFLTKPHTIARGDVEQALASAAHVVEATFTNGAQDHFYLETQASLAVPGEGETMHVYASSQHPTEAQKMIASVLGVGSNQVVCEVPRMGGAFGGKESQSTPFACLAALGAKLLNRPVRVRLDRTDDMAITGKRHPFQTHYRAGFDDDGRLVALAADLFADGGWSIDLSPAIMDRALFHADNAYYIEHIRITGQAVRTNLPSNTAFRGFGGPQGMLVVEDAIHRFSERRGVDPLEVRRRNYYGDAPRDRTHYGQQITHNRLDRVTDELLASSDYAARRAEIDTFNASSRFVRRGLAFQPIKFGISFTNSILNQAGAFLLVYTDGTVQLNHGGTEMGQGLHSKMIAVAAHELGVAPDTIRVMHTATDKVPNTSATAASSGSDLNGQAVADAATTLRSRMRPIAAKMLDAEASRVRFQDGVVYSLDAPDRRVRFSDLARQCWLDRVSLAATGYYATPGIWYDHEQGRGEPFYYYAYGAAVTEVELHALTGEHRVRRVDILHDVGRSLLPGIDRGQVEGGYVQGLGWLTCEEVLHGGDGRGLTIGPSTYKIPAYGDAPVDFRVALLERAPQEGVIHGSKAVGEPPFMLAISALGALRHAIASFGPGEVSLGAPATPEALLRAVDAQQAET
jgi:xanthine dehydrogenase large subunit